MIQSVIRRTLVGVCCSVCFLFIAAWQVPATESDQKPGAPATSPDSKPRTVVPVPRADQWWVDRHNDILSRNAEGAANLVFIGDSITQGWEHAGASAWQRHYAHRKALNLGFSGDRTQHVLWRIENGELDGISPKLAVVMIGTNNSNGNDHTAEEIAAGIKAIVALLREKQPRMKILLLAIFPRGASPNPQREKNARASELAMTLADGEMVHALDIGSRFVAEDGTITADIMPDSLHLSEKGYRVWAEALESKVAELLGDSPIPPAANEPDEP